MGFCIYIYIHTLFLNKEYYHFSKSEKGTSYSFTSRMMTACFLMTQIVAIYVCQFLYLKLIRSSQAVTHSFFTDTQQCRLYVGKYAGEEHGCPQRGYLGYRNYSKSLSGSLESLPPASSTALIG